MVVKFELQSSGPLVGRRAALLVERFLQFPGPGGNDGINSRPAEG